jgi:hypothetical protein
MNDNEKKSKSTKKQKKDSNKITIEICRFQNLLDILKEPKRVLTLSLAITAVGILLFGGITLIVLSVKRLYPYNDITTNAMGTTTLRSENKDVSYFLLNSAELWANSGIKVTKGQTITIKSSGKKHSAIHHLVDDARNNMPELRDPWVGTEGFPIEYDQREERDRERAKYRISPNNNQDVLLLQIVKEDSEKKDRPLDKDKQSNRIVVVGNKMEDIHIDYNGTLFFTVNDIILDDQTIIKMLLECDNNNNNNIDTLVAAANKVRDIFIFKQDSINQKYNKSIRKELDKKAKKTLERQKQEDLCSLYDETYSIFLDSIGISDQWNGRPDSIAKYTKPDELKFGRFEFGLDKSEKHIELYGYFMKKYKNAWYEDNIGSFLILVETVND